MQTVSENWVGILAGQHITNFKMEIAGETYTYADMEINSGSIHLALMETLSLGNAGCGTIEMTFRPKGTIPTMAEIRCFVQISNGKDTIFITGEDGAVLTDHEDVPLVSQAEEAGDWLPFGVFFLDTRKTDAFGWMTITGFDAMLKAEQLYLDNEGQYPMPMADAVAFIAGEMGVEVDPRSAIADYDIDYPAEIYTLREVLGGIGAASGGSWCISPAGQLRLVRLDSPSLPADTPCGSCSILEGGMVTISRVTLYPDDGTKRTAGDDTGYEIIGNCAYATDEMCAALLAQLQGVTYLPLEAGQVLIDPALELGDSITVNGSSTILGEIRYIIGKGMTAEIAAPIDSEINHEYPYGQSGTRKERQLAQAYSAIHKTTEEIRMEVQAADGRYTELQLDVDGLSSEVQGLEGEYAALALTVDGFTVTDGSGTTKIKGSSIDTSTLNVENINIDLTGAIQWKDLSEDVQDEIDTALGYADEALSVAEDAESAVGSITYTYKGKTYVDENCIMAGTVIAGHLMGGTVELLDENEIVQGYLTITDADTADYAVELQSEGAMRLLADGQYAALWLEAGDAAYLAIRTVGSNGYHIVSNRSIVPASDGTMYVGTSYRAWAGMYTETDPVVTSDKKQKKNIRYGMDDLDGFFDDLLPGTYQLIKGTSGRRHGGFMAQDVLENLKKHNISTADFAGYVEDVDENGDPTRGLRYGEFIPLLVDQTQKLKARVARLEESNGKR